MENEVFNYYSSDNLYETANKSLYNAKAVKSGKRIN